MWKFDRFLDAYWEGLGAPQLTYIPYRLTLENYCRQHHYANVVVRFGREWGLLSTVCGPVLRRSVGFMNV